MLHSLEAEETADRRKSFGELMADMDKKSLQMWKDCSPLLNRGENAALPLLANATSPLRALTPLAHTSLSQYIYPTLPESFLSLSY